MATQRPRRNNSPGNTKLKPQPLKATAPLSSLIRNPSPTRRRQSPPVPSPVLQVGDTKNKIRRSPDVFSSEHRTLVSPLGKTFIVEGYLPTLLPTNYHLLSPCQLGPVMDVIALKQVVMCQVSLGRFGNFCSLIENMYKIQACSQRKSSQISMEFNDQIYIWLQLDRQKK